MSQQFHRVMNQPNQHGQTPLHTAAGRGDTEVVREFIRMGAVIMAQDKDDRTPLHLAAEKRHASTVKALLDWDFRPQMLQRRGLMERPNNNNQEGMLIRGPMEGYPDLKTMLRRRGLMGRYPNLKKMLESSLEEIRQFCKSEGYSPDIFEIMVVLKRRRASVNIVDKEGQTALHLAAKGKGNDAIIRSFLIAGASVHMQDNHGQTAVRLAAKESGDNNVGWAEAALEWAMEEDDKMMVKNLLAQDVGAKIGYQKVLGWILDQTNHEMILLLLSPPKKGVDWNTDDGQRALQWAVDNVHIETVQALAHLGFDKFRLSKVLNRAVLLPHGTPTSGAVEFVKILSAAGAEVDAKYDGRTTLYRLVEAFFSSSYVVEVIRALSKAGADGDAEYDGKTALHMAVESAHRMGTSEVVRALLEAGADVNAKYDGKTALAVAVELQLWSVVEVLGNHEADLENLRSRQNRRRNA